MRKSSVLIETWSYSYAHPAHQRLVRAVDWYDESRTLLRVTDRYNNKRVTVSHKQPIMLSKKRPLRLFHSKTTKEVIVINRLTKDVILNWKDKGLHFQKINLNLSSSILKLVMIWVVFYTTRGISWQLWIFKFRSRRSLLARAYHWFGSWAYASAASLKATIVRLRLLYKITQLYESSKVG